MKEHRVMPRQGLHHRRAAARASSTSRRSRRMGIKGIPSIRGRRGDDETSTVETLYGEKTVAYKDAHAGALPCLQGQGAHDLRRDASARADETKDADRFAEVEKIEAMTPGREASRSSRTSLANASAATPAATSARPARCRKCVFDSHEFDSAQKANVRLL